jgi:hypothetical protein
VGIRSCRVALLAFALLMTGLGACSQTRGKMLDVGRNALCVTEGEIENAPEDRMAVRVPKMRAYVNEWTSQAIEARFTYLGPTAQVSRLGSGAARTQFGLKLEAANACNLIYAMWRIEPENKIAVSVKRNQGQDKSSECGNRGYENIKPRHSAAVPLLREGETHTLAAELRGDGLRVSVDGKDVWEGELGADAGGLKGPVGIRSDNARLAFDLKAGAPGSVHPDSARACRTGAENSD